MNSTTAAMASVDPRQARKAAIAAIAHLRRTELAAKGAEMPNDRALLRWAVVRHKELETIHAPHQGHE